MPKTNLVWWMMIRLQKSKIMIREEIQFELDFLFFLERQCADGDCIIEEISSLMLSRH